MRSRNGKVEAQTVVPAIIVIVVVGLMGFVSLTAAPSIVQQTSTSSPNHAAIFYSDVSANGLQLVIAMNSTKIQEGGALAAKVSLFNTLGTNLSLVRNFAGDSGISAWDFHDRMCGLSPVFHIFGFALFQGYYTAANISSGPEPLTLPPPVRFSCPASQYGQAYIHEVDFAPTSDLARVSANASFSDSFKAQNVRMQVSVATGHCSSEPYTETVSSGGNGNGTSTSTAYTTTAYSFGCGPDNSLYGYWTPPMNDSCSLGYSVNGTERAQPDAEYCNFHSFPPGEYTLLGEDLWGDSVYAYFKVTPLCSNPVSQRPGMLEVLMLRPGATGLVCVNYDFSTQQFKLSETGVVSLIRNESNGLVITPTADLGVSVKYAAFGLGYNQTVVFSVSASSNSSGVYTWWAPQKCPGFPIVIASSLTEAGPILKAYYGSVWHCYSLIAYTQITGTSGIDVGTFEWGTR